MAPSDSLLPAQAVRLAALGLLAEEPRRYDDLAREVGAFTGAILGNSVDLMGTSLDLLRYEGLIEAAGGTGMVDNAEMRLTGPGRAALRQLLCAGLNAPNQEINRLVLALKLRFLPLLDAPERDAALTQIREWHAGEIVRFAELRARHGRRSPLFRLWLDREMARARRCLRDLGEAR